MTSKTTASSEKKIEDVGPFVIERTFNAPIPKVWRAITDPAEMKQWYFDLPGFKPEIGYEFEFTADCDGRQYRHLCKVIHVSLEKSLIYSWRYDGYEGDSRVTFELFPITNEQTRLKLTHEGLESFPAAKNPDLAKGNFVQGWTELIGSSLKTYLDKSK